MNHPIPWDTPLLDGIPSSVDTLSSDGHLAFRPLVPAFDVAPKSVLVTDPAIVPDFARAAAFVFDFPPSTDFPDDGRVVVIEKSTQQTLADLQAVVAGLGSHGTLIDITGAPAVLISAHGIGRVHVVRDGLAIDVTGPAVTPEVAVKLAGQIA